MLSMVQFSPHSTLGSYGLMVLVLLGLLSSALLVGFSLIFRQRNSFFRMKTHHLHEFVKCIPVGEHAVREHFDTHSISPNLTLTCRMGNTFHTQRPLHYIFGIKDKHEIFQHQMSKLNKHLPLCLYIHIIMTLLLNFTVIGKGTSFAVIGRRTVPYYEPEMTLSRHWLNMTASGWTNTRSGIIIVPTSYPMRNKVWTLDDHVPIDNYTRCYFDRDELPGGHHRTCYIANGCKWYVGTNITLIHVPTIAQKDTSSLWMHRHLHAKVLTRFLMSRLIDKSLAHDGVVNCKPRLMTSNSPEAFQHSFWKKKETQCQLYCTHRHSQAVVILLHCPPTEITLLSAHWLLFFDQNPLRESPREYSSLHGGQRYCKYITVNLSSTSIISLYLYDI